MAENYVLLETIQLTQNAASVTFDNIPQSGYTDLKVVVSGRAVATSSYPNVRVRFNGDTSANYHWRRIYGNGSSATSDYNTSDTGALVGLIAGSNETANTFSNFEFYVPNYLGSNQKSISADAVSENNATTSYSYLIATLWTGTAAINSINLYSSYNFAQYSTFSLYGVAALGTTPTFAPLATGGNIVANDGTYWYHAFLTSGTFTPQTSLTCDYILVAGGGGGGANGNDRGSGGGGAGGYRLLTAQSVTATKYPVLVGAGGSSGISNANGYQGSISSFNGTNASGGGGGGRGVAGLDGGSGGGAGNGGGTGTILGGAGNQGSYSPVEGYAGGNTIANSGGYNGAGGGGAGGVGANATAYSSADAAGGVGVAPGSTWASATKTGLSGYYAAGGPGAGATMTTHRSNAAAVTGNGGGGSAQGYTAGNGGSGIVIIRYPMA